jgi:uncharacterized protein (TIGR03067 family)
MRCFLLLAVLVSLAFAPAPLPRRENLPGDLKQLQGEWILVRRSRFGQWEDGDRGRTAVIGDRVRIRFLHAEHGEWTIRLDPAKQPKTFDLEAVGTIERVIEPGIYRLEGDTFTTSRLCVDMGGLRPAVFDASNPVLIVEVYQRAKPKR